MTKGLQYPQNVRCYAFQLRGKGLAAEQIAHKLKIKFGKAPHPNSLRRWFRVNPKAGKRGRPVKIDPRRPSEIQKVCRFLRAHKGQASGIQIIQGVTWAPGFNTSRSKMYEFLDSIPELKQGTPMKVYKLTTADRRSRYKFAKKHEHAKVLKWKFTDEKRWTLRGGRTRRVYYLRERGYPTRETNPHSSGGLMTWGLLGADGTAALETCIGTLSGADYKDLLKWHGRHGDFILQDGARAHIEKEVQEVAHELGIHLEDNAVRSPEFNAIERMWCRVSDIVYDHNKTYDNYDDLEAAIYSAWEKVAKDKQFIKSIILSVTSNFQKAIRGRGGPL